MIWLGVISRVLAWRSASRRAQLLTLGQVALGRIASLGLVTLKTVDCADGEACIGGAANSRLASTMLTPNNGARIRLFFIMSPSPHFAAIADNPRYDLLARTLACC